MTLCPGLSKHSKYLLNERERQDDACRRSRNLPREEAWVLRAERTRDHSGEGEGRGGAEAGKEDGDVEWGAAPRRDLAFTLDY